MQKKALLVCTACVAILCTAIAAVRLGADSAAHEGVLTEDEFGRFNTEVFVNGEGPFAFLVDTGAAMSCVSPSFATRLKLARIPAIKVDVQGTSGMQSGSMYLATSYRSGVFDKSLEPLVGLLNERAVKDGVVGMNMFSKRRIELDFQEHRLRSGPSRPLPAGFERLPAQLKGTDVIVDVMIDGVPAKAIVDTGARRTIGNTALRERLGLNEHDPRLAPAEPSEGATQQHLTASAATLRELVLGTARIHDPRVTFSDLDLFQRRGLQETPAILLGMDLMRNLKALAIDYRQAELQMKH